MVFGWVRMNTNEYWRERQNGWERSTNGVRMSTTDKNRWCLDEYGWIRMVLGLGLEIRMRVLISTDEYGLCTDCFQTTKDWWVWMRTEYEWCTDEYEWVLMRTDKNGWERCSNGVRMRTDMFGWVRIDSDGVRVRIEMSTDNYISK